MIMSYQVSTIYSFIVRLKLIANIFSMPSNIMLTTVIRSLSLFISFKITCLLNAYLSIVLKNFVIIRL